MIGRLFAMWVIVVGCGQRPATPTNDGGDSGNGDTGGVTDDATMPDAVTGVLSPEPPDQISTACAGRLAFPTLPRVRTTLGRGLVIVDVDVDGASDILYLDSSGIGTARGNGDGTFAPPSTFGLSGTTHDFRVADVDGDTKPDLVFGVFDGGVHDVRVALNDNNGGFGAAQSYSTNDTRADQVEVADLNGDGKNDLIVLSSSGYEVAVLLRSGNSFTAPAKYAVGGVPYSHRMGVADMTGDGRPDIVVSNSNESTVSVLVNSGTGTFAARVAYPTPATPWGIVLADLNEDGKPDVVVATDTGTTRQLSVLINQGAGVLGTATNFALGGSGVARFLAAADVNGDGHVDIGVAQLSDVRARILFGTGTGQLGAPLEIPSDGPERIAFGNLDADGNLDLVVLNKYAATPYLSSGAAVPFNVRDRYDAGSSATVGHGARMTDLNSDGRLDLLWIGTGGPPVVSALLDNGSGGYEAPTTTPLSVAVPWAFLADVNNDGRADLVVDGDGNAGAEIQTVLNNGNGTMSPIPSPLPVPRDPVATTSADVDGNGVRDLVVGDIGPSPAYVSEVRYYPGFANGQFGTGTVLWTGEALNGLAVADLNGDGTHDVIVASYKNGPRHEVRLGTGSGAFGVATTIGTVLTNRVAARDINADSKVDLIGFTTGEVVAMLGNGDGTFGPPLYSQRGSWQVTDHAFADFDGDGHVDLVVPDAYGVAILRGRGDGTFHSPLSFEAGAQPSTLSVGDVDADGRVDILVNNANGMLSILRGRCL